MTNIVITLTNQMTGDILQGSIAIHSDVSTNFGVGFALVFCCGFLALGARWVRQLIVGSPHEEL